MIPVAAVSENHTSRANAHDAARSVPAIFGSALLIGVLVPCLQWIGRSAAAEHLDRQIPTIKQEYDAQTQRRSFRQSL
jgi:hypothetical protein